jgi:hypothetical protein
MPRAVAHLRRNAIAYLALGVALGGTSYAALRLPANSVGTKQIKKRAVTLSKIAPSAQAALHGAGGAAGPAGPTGPTGPAGATGAAGSNASINGVAAGGALSGTYPNPSLAAGAVGTSAFGTIPAVRVYNTTDELNSGSVSTLAFNSTRFATVASMHSTSTNNSRLVAPVAGTYTIGATVNWADVGTAPGTRMLIVTVNGFIVARVSTPNEAAGTDSQTISTIVHLAANDYAEIEIYETSSGPAVAVAGNGSAPGYSPEAWMAWLGP